MLDAETGEVVAAVSLPEADPRASVNEQTPIDRNTGSIFELGSVFKMVTLAMALEESAASLDTTYDVRETLESPAAHQRPASARSAS